MYLEVPSAQPHTVGIALSADPGAPSAPVVDELLGERLVSYQPVPFVYKVRKTEAPEGRKLDAPDGRARLEIGVGPFPVVSVSLHPISFPSCQSRLTKQIQAKFCYYQ